MIKSVFKDLEQLSIKNPSKENDIYNYKALSISLDYLYN